MTTKRRWLKSVIAAAATEEVFLPWAMARAAKRGSLPLTALHVAAPPAPVAPRLYPRALAAR